MRKKLQHRLIGNAPDVEESVIAAFASIKDYYRRRAPCCVYTQYPVVFTGNTELHLEPASSNSLPANGNGSITQKLRVTNTQNGKGILGPCASLEKKGALCSDTSIGQGGTTTWKVLQYTPTYSNVHKLTKEIAM
ncbi:unnamed protein product [Lactuca saligna]|uniref:Protein transport protein SEC23 n=1 Tax=Lactuca saligna TaxID=75948 RepID=A0AA35Y6J5_LACSI|nr:unnamed protein product [Lactuca saligna]